MENEMNVAVQTTEQPYGKKGIPGSTLKWIAIIAMFIDHFGAIFFENRITNMLPENLNEMTLEMQQEWVLANPAYSQLLSVDMLLRGIGRFGFPIFAFLLVEGVTHTRNIKKYLRNMLIFMLVSEIPFNLAFSGEFFYPGYQNVFFTLGIGVAVLAAIRGLETKEWMQATGNMGLKLLYPVSSLLVGAGAVYLLMGSEIGAGFIPIARFSFEYWILTVIGAVVSLIWCVIAQRKWRVDQKNLFTCSVVVAAVGILLAEVLKTDYAGWGVFTILVMYLLRNNKVKSFGFGCLCLTCMSLLEAVAFFMLIPVAKYNGKRGMSMKYFFYAFYPVHLLLLYLIALAMGIVSFGW